MLDESSPLIAGLTLLVSQSKSALMIEAASMHWFNTLLAGHLISSLSGGSPPSPPARFTS